MTNARSTTVPARLSPVARAGLFAHSLSRHCNIQWLATCFPIRRKEIQQIKDTLIAIAAASSLTLADNATADAWSYQTGASAEKHDMRYLMTNGLVTAEVKNAGRPDIVDTAVSSGSFDTLVAAVQAAGLVDTMKGDGPFTVFAPTDAAFPKLPEGTLYSLLADKQKLVAVLKHHVVRQA